MPTIFRYLVKKDRISDLPTVEGSYKREELISRPVIWNQQNKEYLVFESRQELAKWYETIPALEKWYHETIFAWSAQRLKFDIDASPNVIDALPYKNNIIEGFDEYYGEILNTEFVSPVDSTVSHVDFAKCKIYNAINLIIDAILDELYIAYYGIEDLLPTREDIVVTDSSGLTPNGMKYSFHIIVLPYAVSNNEEAQEFTIRVLERLPLAIRQIVDPDVNKKTQNFRLINSAKPGTNRYKQITQDFNTAKDVTFDNLLIIAPVGARVLSRVYTDVSTLKQKDVKIQDSIVQSALELASSKNILIGHSFNEVRGNLICFTREAPSYCRICYEIHHNDNSLLISVVSENDTVKVVEHCRQARGKSYIIGDIHKSQNADKGFQHSSLQDQISERINAIRDAKIDPHDALVSKFELLPNTQIYSEPIMRPYELVPTLAVLAQMKLGKTKALRTFLAEHFPIDSIDTKVIRFITFRQTFSNSISKDFPDFTVYNNVSGDLTAARFPRLIVQVESLNRLKMSAHPEPIDLLVLDEVESILAQFNSGLHKHFNAAFAMFQWMIQTAHHVVCMDANLSDRTYNMLMRMRPLHPINFHWNQFARASADIYNFTADQSAWLGKLYELLSAGLKIVLTTNSLTEAKAYEEAIRREFPKKSIMLYSSETSVSEKTRHFEDVHSYWGKLEVLIFTPTCSAGVSFELEHFDTLFGYFCDSSCDVETCRQMIGRVRNLRTHEHYICFRTTKSMLPTTTTDIGKRIRDKRCGLYREVDDTSIQFEYDANGEIRFYESNYYHLWVETIRINNLSKNDFARRFIDQVADTGAQIDLLQSTLSLEISSALLLTHREIRKELKETRCNAIATAANIEPEEAAYIREALQSQIEVDPQLRIAYEKYQLCDVYSWHGRPIDAAFVDAYQGFETRRVYRNLCRITKGSTILESLKLMRNQEFEHYNYIMDSRTESFEYVNESRDLLRDKTTYVFQSHFIAIWLLRICGFTCITDKKHIHEELIEARLRNSIPALKNAIDNIVFEFEIPQPNLDRIGRETDRARFLSNILRTINAVLRIMYGLQVKRLTKKATGVTVCGLYSITNNVTGKRFVFSQTPDDTRPHIQSNLLVSAHEKVNLFLDSTYYASELDEFLGEELSKKES